MLEFGRKGLLIQLLYFENIFVLKVFESQQNKTKGLGQETELTVINHHHCINLMYLCKMVV